MIRNTVQRQGGSKYLPDYVYYNADIINGTAADFPTGDTSATYNETRDAPIISDASQYRFSVISFTANGIGRSLPLFIPSIQNGSSLTTTSGTGGNQTNVNLTNYGVAFTFKCVFSSGVSGATLAPLTVAPPLRYTIFTPENTQAPIPALPKVSQDNSTQYYWMSSYQSILKMLNLTIFNPADTTIAVGVIGGTCAWWDVYYYLYEAALSTGGTTASGFNAGFPTFADFVKFYTPPQWVFNQTTNTFSLYMDSRCFNVVPTTTTLGSVALVAYAPGTNTNVFAYSPVARAFMNSNMYGLFANLPVKNWGTSSLPTLLPSIQMYNTTIPAANLNTANNTPGIATSPTSNGVSVNYPYEILPINNFYQNVSDYRLAPYNGTTPNGYVPTGQQSAYWVVSQDFPSIDSIWSPVEGLYLLTNLMPVRKEFMSAPIPLGSSDIGLSSATSGSAFEPILGDFHLNLSQKGAQQYRQFAYFEPSAEFRISDFTSSKEEIHSIDVKLYWRSRLDGQLYPVNMFNLSNFSLKIMFKNKDI